VEPDLGIQGIVATDKKGQVAFASGLGRDPRVHALVTDRSWMKEAATRRLQPLILDRRNFVGVVVPGAEFDLIVLSSVSDAVLDFIGSVDFSYKLIEQLLTDPFDAMTVVDADARVVYISPVHEGFFGLARGEANGRPVREVIENTRLDKVVASGRAEIGQIQRMKGLERVVTRVPISHRGKVVGAVGRIMFKGPEQVEVLSRRVNVLESEVEFYKRQAATLRKHSYGLDDLLGESPAMRRLRQEIVKIAPLEMPVLIYGESGTGKELIAHSLHRLSSRRDAPMVMVNAAALPATLVESELFGYEAGSFTGADRKGRKGKFEQAAGGTMFLDEIGDMPIEVQSKLLRVLQDRLVERLGGDRPREVNFRLITATHHDLSASVAEGKFRLDLYYRISPLILEAPALRDRAEDIELLVSQFLTDIASRHARPAPTLTPSAVAWLTEQAWPGNVRQLRHEIERAFVFAEGNLITVAVLTRHADQRPAQATRSAALTALNEPVTLRNAVLRTEATLVRESMKLHRGNKKRVAQELGISRSYLYKILGELEGDPLRASANE
jgi:PAS domain S-box-containing protein